MASLKRFQDIPDDVNLEDLHRLWRSFLKLSRDVGSFPFVAVNGNDMRSWWMNPWNFYSIFSLCLCSGRLCVIIYSKTTAGWSISLLDVDFLSVAVFPFHLVISIAMFIYFLNFTTCLNDLCHLWSSMSFRRRTAAKVIAGVRRKMKCALAFCALAMLQALYGLIFEIHQMCRSGFSVTGVIYELSTAWCIIVQVIQTGLFCSLCFAISCLLDGICQEVEVKLAKGRMGIHLKVFKDMYTTIYDFIQVSNKLFGIFVGFLVTSSLLQACFDTYTLVVHTNIHKNIFGIAIFVVYNLLTTVLICLSAGEIPDQAKRLYRILLKINLSKCSSVQQNEALMLLDCVKHLDANISIFRIMPITIQTLPAITSIYFSYLFLLFQFPTRAALASEPKETKNDSITL